MIRRINIFLLVLCAGGFFIQTLAAELSAAESGKSDRPNILFILADDVGREVLECYGGSSYQTPNLNRLAATGAKFEHCYSMPVCHPTRICLLTGQYPRHIGNPRWGSFPENAETRTFASIAKRAGYATAVAGKWQLNLMTRDLGHPGRLGFDEWSLFAWHEGARYHEPMIHQNGKLLENTAGKYGPDLYVDFLVDFMKRQKDRKNPFLAYYSMALCHDVTDDIDAPVPYGPRGRYDNFAEMAEQMDERIGRVMHFLDKSKLWDSTLVLFTTDNGTAGRSKISAIGNQNKFIYENVVSKFHGQDIPGGKGQLTDWGTRVPMIAVWKNVIKPGQSWDNLVDFSDLLPTFADLTEGTLPLGVPLDGHSFSGLLRGDGKSKRRWAYAEGKGGRFFAKTQRHKLYNSGQFFDTEADAFEKRALDVSSLNGKARRDFESLQKAISTLNRRAHQ